VLLNVIYRGIQNNKCNRCYTLDFTSTCPFLQLFLFMAQRAAGWSTSLLKCRSRMPLFCPTMCQKGKRDKGNRRQEWKHAWPQIIVTAEYRTQNIINLWPTRCLSQDYVAAIAWAWHPGLCLLLLSIIILVLGHCSLLKWRSGWMEEGRHCCKTSHHRSGNFPLPCALSMLASPGYSPFLVALSWNLMSLFS
jgi:hypothetical protein